jgi:type I restriction enzyme R subunit
MDQVENYKENVTVIPKLKNVDDDTNVRNLVFNLLQMNENLSDGEIQVEAMKQFGEKYPTMDPNDWRHLIDAYTPSVREAMDRNSKEIVLQLKNAASPEDEEDDDNQ